MSTHDAAHREEECLHCKQAVGTETISCCDAARRDEDVIRYLPLLAANDYLELEASALRTGLIDGR